LKSSYQALDYYKIDDLLTEEEKMIRDLVREWVSIEVIPVIGKLADEGKFPDSFIKGMAELGLFGATLEEEYGGSSASQIAYGLMMQELERGDSGLRSFASVQSALVMYPIHRYGDEAQKKKWLPELASGRLIGCFGLTEPNHGSDPGGMETKAVRDGNDFILNGAKMWITNGSIGDISIVWGKLDEIIRGFVIDHETPGFSTIETVHKWSLRASVTSELIMEDCRIPASALLQKTSGLGAPLSCLTQARYGIAWGVIGAAMACYDEAKRYALERKQFDKPLAAFQLVQNKLTEMATEITKAQFLNLRLGQLKQNNQHTAQMVSMAKRNGCYQALRIARTARDILGAAGITYEFQAGRHMLNLESVITYEGTHDIHSLIVAADLTGIEAFR